MYRPSVRLLAGEIAPAHSACNDASPLTFAIRIETPSTETTLMSEPSLTQRETFTLQNYFCEYLHPRCHQAEETVLLKHFKILMHVQCRCMKLKT
jgi:hypothetical protein